MRSYGSLALFASLTFAGAVQAASQFDNDECAKKEGERTIAACTRIIHDQSEGAKIRVVALHNRGTAYRLKDDNNRAMADYNEAVRLDPKYCPTSALVRQI